jgi:DNA polymerase-3 subunit beta
MPKDRPQNSTSATAFFTAKAGELAKGIKWGLLCAYIKDELPQYLSSVYFEIENGLLHFVSTDKKRLALSRVKCPDSVDGCSAMIPSSEIQELQKILRKTDADVEVKVTLDDVLVYFVVQDIEFSIRQYERRFPPYKKYLPKSACTTVSVEKKSFRAALGHMKDIVGKTDRMVILTFDNDSECVLSGVSQEFGEVVETIPCSFSGEPVRAGFNINFLIPPVNLITSPKVSLSFESSDGYLQVKNEGTDDFRCLIAPMELDKETNSAPERESGKEELI